MRLQFGSPLAASLSLSPSPFSSMHSLSRSLSLVPLALSTVNSYVLCLLPQLLLLCLSSSLSSSLSLFSLLLPIAILHYAAIFHIRLSCDCGSSGWAFPLLFQLLLTLFIYLLFLPSPPCLLPSPRFSTHISLGFSSFFVAFALCVQSSVISDIHARKHRHTYAWRLAGRHRRYSVNWKMCF